MITPNYIPSTNDPLICKEANKTNPKTFPRKLQKFTNKQGTPYCECPAEGYRKGASNKCVSTPEGTKLKTNRKCSDYNGISDTNNICYYCKEQIFDRSSINKYLRPKPSDKNTCYYNNDAKWTKY